jgi:hypothetical protein
VKFVSISIPNKVRLLFLLLVFLFTQIVILDAEETKDQRSFKKPLILDHITAFDGNRIYTYVSNNGHIVSRTIDRNAGFFWPSIARTSREQDGDAELRGDKTADYASGLWVIGTVNDTPRCAIAMFQSEFIGGKILPNGQRDDVNLDKYRVYKIMKGDGPGVKDWDEWPVEDGAPVNPDGTPKLIGDQTLWYVINDLEPARHQGPINGSDPIGLEVQTTIFGFNDPGPLGDIMFVQWRIINKGAADLDSAFIGVFDDPDLGDWSDDLVGADTSLGLAFCYNGDSYDGQYGTNTPAEGFDFFQGPEVPKGSGNFLKMTSFAKPTNRGAFPIGDPTNVQEVYNYMTGYWQDGSPFIDPITGEETKFIHTGDPVTGTGNLDFNSGDRRFLMSSGPFTLAVGDTQIIVGAKIIAPGVDPPSSVNALRYFDKFAQGAFDNNFDVMRSPDVTLDLARLDQEIILSWDEDADEIESFNKLGYQFQGYIVYQGESSNGPWKQIAIFDLDDGIQGILDEQLDPETNLIISAPVVVGKDLGLQRYISIKKDVIFNPGQRLSNYRDYYFAVTSYSVNLNSIPRVVESTIVGQRVASTATDFGVTITEEYGDTIGIDHTPGIADGTFFAKVVDPTVIPDANYRIKVENDHSMSVEKNGSFYKSFPELDQNGVSNYTDLVNAPLVDGVQIHLVATFDPPTTFDGTAFKVNADTSDGDLTLLDFIAFLWPTTVYNPLTNTDLLSRDLEFRFTGLTANGDDDNDAPIIEGGQWTTQWERAAIWESSDSGFAHVQMRAPFELWDVENNQQVNFAVFNRNFGGSATYGDSVGDPNTPGMEPRWRITGWDFIIPIMTEYDPQMAENTIFSPTDSNATWILFFTYWSSIWSNGDVYTVLYTNPLKAGSDEFVLTTQKGMVSGQKALKKKQLQKINVVPNPYWAHNPGERDGVNHFIRFTNLPGSGVKIRIFTLAADLIKVIDDSERSKDGTLDLQYANWDLRNDAGIPVASGIYIIHFEVEGVGNVVRKAAIIMAEERLKVF